MLLWLSFGAAGLVGLNVVAIGLCRAAGGRGIDRAASEAVARRQRADTRHRPGTAA